MKETVMAFLSATAVIFNVSRWAAHCVKKKFIFIGFSATVFLSKQEQSFKMSKCIFADGRSECKFMQENKFLFCKHCTFKYCMNYNFFVGSWENICKLVIRALHLCVHVDDQREWRQGITFHRLMLSGLTSSYDALKYISYQTSRLTPSVSVFAFFNLP